MLSFVTQFNLFQTNDREPKAQIGYVYQDSTGFSNYSSFTANQRKPEQPVEPIKDDEDLDLALDTDQLTGEHKGILNKCATSFGMEYGDYIRMLILDDEEKEKIQMNKLLEAEKAQYSVRESRNMSNISVSDLLFDMNVIRVVNHAERDGLLKSACEEKRET